MVVSLEKTGVKMWGVYPGGQSGNPGSAYYNNMTASWLNGDYYPMKLMKVPEEGTATMLYRIDLHPTQ